MSVLRLVLAVLLTLTYLVVLPAASASATPPGFTDTVALSGLNAPTNVAFAPDGRIFVTEKSGLVKVFDGLADPTPTVFADLRPQVQDYWDRGLLGLAVHPRFPVVPHVYVAYTYDALPGGAPPAWATPVLIRRERPWTGVWCRGGCPAWSPTGTSGPSRWC